MLKTINLLRFSVQCCGKCRGLVSRISTSAVWEKRESVLLKEKLKFLESERKKYEDTFGDIDGFERKFERIQDDPEDIAEYEREREAKGKSIGEYKAEISELLTQHKYKEAIRVLEVDMVNDKIRYDIKVIGIFRMLFNYTALKGDLEEAYRLYVWYRGRQGRMTGPMYTALFNACANCRNSFLALKKAQIIRENLAEDKLHKVNIFNYNSMLKAFGRHGDIPTCLKIFDEVLEKRLKAFTPTYSFLLQSCLSDKNSGLRHALMVWRKMLQNRRKPDIWFFNLFLRCVRDCSLGDVLLIPDLLEQLNKESGKFFKKKLVMKKVGGKVVKKIVNVPVQGTEFLQYIGEDVVDRKKEMSDSHEVMKIGESSQLCDEESQKPEMPVEEIPPLKLLSDECKNFEMNAIEEVKEGEMEERETEGDICQLEEDIPVLESVVRGEETVGRGCEPELPDLMGIEPCIGSVVDFNALTEPHHRIMLFGGVKGFLKTMAAFKVQPNVLTLSLLLGVSPPTEEAEQEIIELAKTYNIQLDAPFFSQLIRKRIYSDRSHLVKDSLSEMQKANVHPDLMCFGVLAFACDTCEKGMELLESMKVYGFRPNCEILYGLLHKAGYNKDFAYVKAILDRAKADDVELDAKFIAKLGRIVRSETYERLKSSREAAET